MADLDTVAHRSDLLKAKHNDVLGDHAVHQVAICGDADYLATAAGQITWAITLNLLARLYRGISRYRLCIDPGVRRLPKTYFPNDEDDLLAASVRLLDQLNPSRHYVVETGAASTDDGWLTIVIGGQANQGALTIAGLGWHAFINHDGWRDFSGDDNPVGPMLAAALGVAQAYLCLYPLKDAEARAIVLSAFDYSDELAPGPSLPATIDFGQLEIAGAGALGMALLLVLGSISGADLRDVIVVDHDRIDGTNLNRCVLAVLADLTNDGSLKTEIVMRELERLGAVLGAEPLTWTDYLGSERAAGRRRVLVASCVDKFEAREQVQFHDLPKLLLTGGTGDFSMRVSRHDLSDGRACGLCYQAKTPVRCSETSDDAAELFDVPPDPSIGFVSLMAGVLMAAELIKEVVPGLSAGRVDHSVRAQALTGKARTEVRAKDPSCDCNSPYVARGYAAMWG